MSNVIPYQHLPSGHVVFGAGAASALSEQRALRSAARVLLLSDAGVAAAGLVARVQRGLEGRVALVDTGVVPDGDARHVEELAGRAQEAGVDAIVALGGGSVIDSAKGVAVVMARGGPLSQWEGLARVRARLLPIVAVPTTTGTGSECTQFAVVLDREQRRKIILIDQSLVPGTAVLDPELVLGLPREVTAATGVDALTHAVEALASRMRNPFGVSLAAEAARMLVCDGVLARCLVAPDDLEARGRALSAAALAGQAVSTCMLGACHAFAHALGARFGVAHGVANGLFLPRIMRFNLPRARVAYARLGQTLGGQGDESALAEHAIAQVERVIHEEAGIPRHLRDLDIPADALEGLAALVLSDPDLATNPVQLTERERVVEILQSCW